MASDSDNVCTRNYISWNYRSVWFICRTWTDSDSTCGSRAGQHMMGLKGLTKTETEVEAEPRVDVACLSIFLFSQNDDEVGV